MFSVTNSLPSATGERPPGLMPQHDRCTGVVHKVTGWFSSLFLDPSPQGCALRATAMPAIAQDPTRVPDHILSGPDLPADESVRRRFLEGELDNSQPVAASA